MAGTVSNKCPNCGAGLEFSRQSNRFECEYCGSSYAVEQISTRHSDDLSQIKTTQNSVQEEFRSYLCPSCGAAVIVDNEVVTAKCYYCNSGIVLIGKFDGEFKPSRIIPFTVKEDRAKVLFENLCGKYPFLEPGFKNAVINDMKGVYIPFWSSDYSVTADFKSAHITKYTLNNVDITKTFNHIRKGEIDFKDALIDAAKNADDLLMDNLEPFHLRKAKPFNSSFLFGYAAQTYDVKIEEVPERVNIRTALKAKTVFENDIKSRIPKDYPIYDGFHNQPSVVTHPYKVIHNKVDIRDESWDLVLLPVWFVRYKYRGKYYEFGINGQTGKMSGNLPVSRLKLGLLAAAYNAVAALAWILVNVALGPIIMSIPRGDGIGGGGLIFFFSIIFIIFCCGFTKFKLDKIKYKYKMHDVSAYNGTVKMTYSEDREEMEKH